MHKTIAVDDLRIGMFIAGIGPRAEDASSGSSIAGLVISGDHIAALAEFGVRQVVIDVSRGLDISSRTARPADPMADMLAGVHAAPRPGARPLAEELGVAQGVLADTFAFMRDFMGSGGEAGIEAVRPHVSSLMQSLKRNSDALLGLASLRAQDESTYKHSVRVAILAMVYGRYLGAEDGQLMRLGMAGLLHDIGMAALPADVIHAKRPLSEDETRLMRTHVALGRSRLESSAPAAPADVLAAVGQHHERYDGSGYPHGLCGDAITPMAQMLGLMDSYDTLTSPRPYKVNMIPSRALSLLYGMHKEEFAPGMVERFIKCVGVYPLGSLVRLDDGHVGVVCETAGKSPARPDVRIVLDRSGRRMRPMDIRLSEAPERKVVECLSPREVSIDPAAVFMG